MQRTPLLACWIRARLPAGRPLGIVCEKKGLDGWVSCAAAPPLPSFPVVFDIVLCPYVCMNVSNLEGTWGSIRCVLVCRPSLEYEPGLAAIFRPSPLICLFCRGPVFLLYCISGGQMATATAFAQTVVCLFVWTCASGNLPPHRLDSRGSCTLIPTPADWPSQGDLAVPLSA
ncbi:hypothetical protein DdX_01093 [Ditylenchus destructor]|uniref:Uncharacterized protein n=1 Tax=Ditylenchus destructor TaxID=166010 RepID=A0AAD4RDQ7_9BILA|nr:hypothetical protein DdX_01093 [Ditylenchus destructor]